MKALAPRSILPFFGSALLLVACSSGTGDEEDTGDGAGGSGIVGDGDLGLGGDVGSGGGVGTGGALGTGGGASGGVGTGGGVGAGGGLGAGGDVGTGGAPAGGAPGTGGDVGTGGEPGTGGAVGSGGSNGSCDSGIRAASPLGGFAHNVTGGQGGNVVNASTGTEIHAAICNRAADDTPLIIMVNGTITPGNTTAQSGSCNTTDGQIELKEISNISLIGVGTSGVLDQTGIHIRTASNIIIQNLTIRNVRKENTNTPSNGGDAIGVEADVDRLWIDHNLIHGSTTEGEEHDGLIDFKDFTTNVTVSYNHLHTGGRGGLIGSNDDGDDGSNNITFHHNWYQNINSRTHLIREATVHFYNNYYIDILETGINARNGASLLVESNYFTDANNPLGTFFYLDNPGVWDVEDNHFSPSVTWQVADDQVPAGPDVESTGSVSVPYSYTTDPAECVPAIVQANAGVGKI